MNDTYEDRVVPADCPYTLADIRIAGGDETLRFQADLLADGQRIAVVSNAGEGGCHLYRPYREAGWGPLRVFRDYATTWGLNLGVKWEADDALIYALLEQWAEQMETQTIYGSTHLN